MKRMRDNDNDYMDNNYICKAQFECGLIFLLLLWKTPKFHICLLLFRSDTVGISVCPYHQIFVVFTIPQGPTGKLWRDWLQF